MNRELFEKYGIKKDTMLKAALKYAEYGLAVFPLVPQGKKPITAHGLNDATTDPETIRDMFTKYPYSNIGMACGAQSGGIVVVDVDMDEEEGKDGHASLKDWERKHGEIPETAMTLTGRGGNHCIYFTTGPTQSRIACLEDVDIRADGGYIVLPPSIHPNGNQYVWETDIEDYGIMPANKSVLELMKEGVEPGKSFTMPEKVPSGKRNETLYKLACSMQARGDSDYAIMAAVKAENEVRCHPPLDEDEVERIVKSATTKPKGTAPYLGGENRPGKHTDPLAIHTFQGIKEMDLKPPTFLIDGLLPVGMCLLGAPPKMGKSWMALDIGIQVAKGGTFLGRRCKKNGVLYLALEDSWYRLQERAEKLQGGEPVPTNLYLSIQADVVEPGDKKRGLYFQLEQAFEEHDDIKLVIIDTLQMVTPSKQRGDDAYASAYTLMNSIRPFWQDREVGFLLVHHTRKRSINDLDPFETFLGSQGLMGATDAMYIIQHKKDDDFCNFYGRGRDFDDVSLAIRRNDITCRWESIGNSDEIKSFRERKEYEVNPIVVCLRDIVSQANGNSVEIMLKDFRDQIMEDYGIVVSANNKAFSNEVMSLANRLAERDGIIIENLGFKSRGGRKGTFFRISVEKTDIL